MTFYKQTSFIASAALSDSLEDISLITIYDTQFLEKLTSWMLHYIRFEVFERMSNYHIFIVIIIMAQN